MNVVLCTNNKYEDPFLHSQLLNIYDKISFIKNKYLFCRSKNNKIIEGVINIDYGKLTFLVYFFKLLCMIIKINEENTIFHVRGYVSAFIFYFAKNIVFWKKINYIYDPRGAFVVEFSESNFSSKDNILLKILRLIEKKIISRSQKTIVTTKRFKELYFEEYGYESKYIVLYNTSAFSSLEFSNVNLEEKEIINICYIGSIDHWHNLDEIIRVLKYTKEIVPKKTKIYFFTNYSDKNNIKIKLEENLIYDYHVGFIPYSEVETSLKKMDICISIVEPTRSQLIASPIKISDYIQLNKIIISNSDIGDFDDYYKKYNSVKLYPYGKELNFDFNSLINLDLQKNFDLKEKLNIKYNLEKITKILNKIKR